MKGLECLVSILKCMVEWSRDYYIDPATTGLNTVRVIRAAPGQSVANEVDGGAEGVRVKGVSVVPVVEGDDVRSNSLEEYESRKMRKGKMQQGILL